MLKTVLFDLDGTLIDSVGLILAAYRHTMLEHYGAPLPDEQWIAGIGTPIELQMAQFADAQNTVEALLKTYRTFTLEHHSAYVRAFDGIHALIEELETRSLSLGIVSSKRRVGVLRGLKAAELEGRFKVIVGADDHHTNKPDPGPVHFALSQLGAPPEEALFVGDSPHDMEAGAAAGVQTAAALWGPFTKAQLQPTLPGSWLEQPGDLLKAL